MNDNAIKNYAIWARRELISEVAKKCAFWGISDGDCPSAAADSIDGRVLTSLEKRQRADLLRQVKAQGFEQFVETAAYTWFNRILAIRFMEVNDRLPSHVRVLSAQDGAFAPQALQEALDLPLDALDAPKAAELVQAGDDEGLFKLVFLAQCDQLAECMPAVFDRIGGAMELMLPDGLLREGGVIEQLVSSIQESDWLEGVEVIGWMYQYYVSERKDEVFASFKKGKKAERDAIAPATQLFTPNWIVRYLTENSLGRLWMLNYPGSSLTEHMPYFINPGDDAETEFKKVSSPEEITVVDPACGSGHILVYAFDLLARMYAEAGYSDREAARLIVEKNLSGFEIDPRAAAMASFAVTMKACELDSRFLRRGVTPQITVLNRIEFDNEEKSLLRNVSSNLELLDVAAHLDECGSLFKPSQKDLDDIAGDLASLAGDESLFAATATEKLERLQAELQPLAERYDVVVANPPYMGSSSLGKWNGKWIKDNFPEAYRDLCTSFIDRGFSLSNNQGYSAMVTMQSWMFLGSYEKLRGKLLRNHTISSMAHLGTRAFGAIGGEVVSTTATVFAHKKYDVPGTYLRLVDMGSEQEKAAGALEALANPDCGWLYRVNAETFEAAPSSPIAYWMNKRIWEAYEKGVTFADVGHPKVGMQTSNNDKYLRLWWEINRSECFSDEMPPNWVKYLKGGDYRKWYGNLDYLLHYKKDPSYILQQPHAKVLDLTYLQTPKCTWTDLTSGEPSFRYAPEDTFYDISGHCFFPDRKDQLFLLAYANSSMVAMLKKAFNSSFHFQCGDLAKIIVPIVSGEERKCIEAISCEQIELSKADWDSFESSWDFKKHPLV